MSGKCGCRWLAGLIGTASALYLAYRYLSEDLSDDHSDDSISYTLDTYSVLPSSAISKNKVYHYVCLQDPDEEWSAADLCRVMHLDLLGNPDTESILSRMVKRFIREENYDAFTHLVLRVENFVAVLHVSRVVSDHRYYVELTYRPNE